MHHREEACTPEHRVAQEPSCGKVGSARECDGVERATTCGTQPRECGRAAECRAVERRPSVEACARHARSARKRGSVKCGIVADLETICFQHLLERDAREQCFS